MDISFKDSIVPVIMAGGSGTRLWPMSRESRPKQFLPWDDDISLLQMTLARARRISSHTPLVVCQEKHRFLAAEQLRESDAMGGLILEPEGKNTAPTVAVAAQLLLQGVWKPEAPRDPLLLVLPADHVIGDIASFAAAIASAEPLALAGALVTFGVVPTRPETGYGYIEAGLPDGDGFGVKRFVEKPEITVAEEYLQAGGYFWNSGMFLFRASRFWQELCQFQPEMADVCAEAVRSIEQDLDFYRLPSSVFLRCPADSIDYAVMERTQSAVVVPLDAQWSDVGNWQAWWEVAEKASDDNAVVGDVVLSQCAGNLVRAESRLVAMVGVSDHVVIETKDAVLVAHRSALDGIKALVAELKSRGRPEILWHREIVRPWGKFDCIDQGDRYHVKRITVSPGARLSLQMHHHRAEHWVVVTGTAEVTRGEDVFLVRENESTYIHLGEVHSLKNPGLIPLELIEVQSGSYLGEDDIVRFKDAYGRVAAK